MKNIVITGPESSGKTTLAGFLSLYLTAPLVKEYAVEYLQKREGKYGFHDLERIAKGQVAQENAIQGAHKFCVCDTDMTVMYVWSMFRYNRVCDYIMEHLETQIRDRIYLLCKPDIPWEPHPLRENPEDRDLLFDQYRLLFMKYDIEPCIIYGDLKSRNTLAVKALRTYR